MSKGHGSPSTLLGASRAREDLPARGSGEPQTAGVSKQGSGGLRRAELEPRTPQILLERRGTLATIILNRPEALNALSLDMVEEMRRLLDVLEADPSVACVALRGSGERGLCAGGDIRTLYNSAKSPDGWPEVFWPAEYALNARIACYPKPYVAFMDGIVMGGGIGVSAHARHRIVTERTKVAMPEVGIGLIPDVGGTWLLSRPALGEAGTYLALTGTTVGAADAIHSGLGDYYIPSARFGDITEVLAGLPPCNGPREVMRVLNAFEAPKPPSRLCEERALIDAAFGLDTIEEIEAALSAANAPFAQEALQTMLSKSPTSLKVTLRLLRLARKAENLEECLGRELSAVLHATRLSCDMVEGIRAAVIDKDRNPRWNPATLAEVSEAHVRGFLSEQTPPIPFHEELKS